jgi:hypothetical protein
MVWQHNNQTLLGIELPTGEHGNCPAIAGEHRTTREPHYLAGRTEPHSAQQRRYLDWAATVIGELQHHPKLRE